MDRPENINVESVLRQHYLFAAFDDARWRPLKAHLRVRDLATGERLFSQNDAADMFFVVLSGAIKLYRLSSGGQEKIMRLVNRGQSFAESILFADEPVYPVHAQALSASQLVAIAREPYLDLLRESFDTCRAVMAQMTRRIYAHWDEIEALSLSDSQQRVAHYLLSLVPQDQAGPVSVRLPARKNVIAAQLGLMPETLSRMLRAFSERGLLEVHATAITISDLKGLRAAAAS
ncbi:MAG TPA: Crp/Fnr family transcriptional regulator [Stenotrophobium sp.]|jgi:CRP-like cAMP-binding protein|nr:Crp/Fnr family transcriptional regulator [Stenotrophobium sp.]